ncbi:MAG: hypothetical protein IJR71_07780 [Prevotella sp.]|nr:hypothetical protein [Prevotella sp.]
MNGTLVFGIIIAVCALLVIYNYLHKKHLHFTLPELKDFIEKVFEQANSASVEKKHFLAAMKEHYHCSSKEAMFLLGKARENRLVDVEDKNVVLMK